MTGNERQLNDQLLKRTKNERIITELSGKSIKEQRAAQMAAVADSAFQAALVGMGEQGAELTTFVAGLPGPIGDAVKQIIAFGTVTDEQSARLIATIPGLRETLENNIENNLRELGFGDVSVNKKMKDLNKILYDMLLKLKDNKKNAFELNKSLVVKYFDIFNNDKTTKYQEFSQYFVKFYNFCFELPHNSILKKAINFKH